MSEQPQLAEHVIDLLANWGEVRAKRMFGGVGLFRDDRMFGLIFDGQLYFRVDRATAEADCERAFGYQRGQRWVRLPYLRVDAETLESPEALASLAGAAWLAAGTRQRTSKGANR